MAYICVYKNWLPYALMSDKRGFISRRFSSSHSGVDSVGNQVGNPVCAVIDGKVLEVYTSSTLGKVVKYGRGNVVFAYYHLASTSVSVGQAVTAGKTKIGVEGSTGSLSSGKHLHTSMWINGSLVDPEPYLSGSKVIVVKEDGLIMVRKVIRNDLNLRSGAGASYSSYGMIPNGTLINPVETTTVSGAIWGKHTCVMADGKTYTGWSNLGDTWSKVYTGAVFENGNTTQTDALNSTISTLNAKIEAAKKALG